MIIRKGYELVYEHSINDLHDEPYCSHRRLRVFHHKGTRCVACGCVGTRLITTHNIKNNSYHTDLYTEDLKLMTIDHTIPKSKGGSSKLKNLQPMCEKCNTEKGNK